MDSIVAYNGIRSQRANSFQLPLHKSAATPDTISGMVIQMLNTTGGRVRVLREDRGLTQKELAAAIGISGEYISQIEAGKKMPNARHLIGLANALDTNIDYILLRTDNPTPMDENIDRVEYMTPEADAVAQIVDGLPQSKRSEILAIVRVIANEYAAQQASTDEAAEQLRTALLQVRKFTPSIYNDVLRIMRDAGVVSS